MPRPKKNLAPRDYRRLEDWLFEGKGLGHIAKLLGMSLSTLRRSLREDKRAGERRDWGLARRESWLVERLHDPNVTNKTPAIFELKARHKWIDQPKEKPEQSRVSIEVRIPAPLSPKQYEKLIDVTPPKALKEAGVEDDG